MKNELIEKAKRGDKNAFALIFSEDYRKELYVIAKGRLAEYEDVKDAVQDTIEEAFRNICFLRDSNKFESWIVRILINKCNNIYRDKNRGNISYCEELELMNKDSENDFVNIEDAIDLFTMTEFLDPDEKDIIYMYSKGYTSKEISNTLMINENTVRTKIKRALEKIRNKYNR